jgi:hypothetical protein
VLQGTSREIQDPNDLEEFVKEASEVKQITQMQGWAILERDIRHYKNEIGKKLAYINPKRKEFEEIRILFLASDKLLSMVNDYQENRDIAIELLNKINNPDLAVTMDVDTE